jgi:hypothetical protein
MPICASCRRSYSRESLEEGPEQGREHAGAAGGTEAAQEAGSSPAGSEAVRSAMANTRTAELASLAEQADIRQGCRVSFSGSCLLSLLKWHVSVMQNRAIAHTPMQMCNFQHLLLQGSGACT